MVDIVFWKDREKEIIDPFLFSEKAMEFAKDLADDNKKSSKCNKRTQIRKFYDEVLRLNTLAKSKNNHNESDWKNILPILHMLTAKAAYAEGRELVSNSFTKFVKSSVNQVEEPKDLEIFSNFFEAFMGFYRLYGPKS